jgi:ubiquinone/menaquinone biosynthesis C-methylase UbiE
MQPNAPSDEIRGKQPGEVKKPSSGSTDINEMTSLRSPPVNKEMYDTDYFIHHAGGADWYDRLLLTDVENIYPIYRQVIENLKPKPNERVLDIGCGRGEIVGILAVKGVQAFGLDFSSAALKLASTVRDAFRRDQQTSFHLVRADATAIPFPAMSFDHIVLSDVVEHLHNWQLEKLYSECWRVLKPLGSIVVHTWPNLWHTKHTYPFVARISRLLRIPRPLNHRQAHDEIMHVNEQSLRSIRYGLRRANFKICKSWCEHNASLSWNPRSIVYWFFHRAPGLRLFFADHIWVLAMKDR